MVRWLHTANLDGVEPFGFADGISQPEIDWAQQRDAGARRASTTATSPRSASSCSAIRNEYGKYTDRPLLDADADERRVAAAEDAPEKKDLGRNGTYLVMRQLRQDVRGFWQFVVAAGRRRRRTQAERLAATLVGRTTRRRAAGAGSVTDAIPGIGSQPEEIRQNQFTFDGDPRGVALSVRRARAPRQPAQRRLSRAPDRDSRGWSRRSASARDGFRDDLMSSVRFHRILRRGREYGPGSRRAEALAPAPPDDPERGLHFICLNANISRQFEFLQNAWMMSSKFSGLTGESDPLLGTRASRSRLSGDRRLHDAAGRAVRRAALRPAAVRHRPRRRVFLSARHPRAALPGWSAMILLSAD